MTWLILGLLFSKIPNFLYLFLLTSSTPTTKYVPEEQNYLTQTTHNYIKFFFSYYIWFIFLDS